MLRRYAGVTTMTCNVKNHMSGEIKHTHFIVEEYVMVHLRMVWQLPTEILTYSSVVYTKISQLAARRFVLCGLHKYIFVTLYFFV
jgi:hypothetical protein